jgi:hypothetical protein
MWDLAWADPMPTSREGPRARAMRARGIPIGGKVWAVNNVMVERSWRSVTYEETYLTRTTGASEIRLQSGRPTLVCATTNDHTDALVGQRCLRSAAARQRSRWRPERGLGRSLSWQRGVNLSRDGADTQPPQ